MVALYLHGYNSSPNPDKIAFLHDRGLATVAPPIDYHKPLVYQRLEALARALQPDLIIGSSMGAYLGFYMARVLNIPTLLFNPAFVNPDNFYPLVDKTGKHKPLQSMVVGLNDDVINPRDAMFFVFEIYGQHLFTVDHTLGHQVPLHTFKEHVNRWLFVQEQLATENQENIPEAERANV